MTTPNLDEATKEALNRLSNRAQYIVAGIDVFNYGFDGLIHSVLLQRAREVIQGNIPLDEFVRTYELRDFAGSISRTKELERLVELERFQKLTVGRELKMVELKKENEELKKKLGLSL